MPDNFDSQDLGLGEMRKPTRECIPTQINVILKNCFYHCIKIEDVNKYKEKCKHVKSYQLEKNHYYSLLYFFSTISRHMNIDITVAENAHRPLVHLGGDGEDPGTRISFHVTKINHLDKCKLLK